MVIVNRRLAELHWPNEDPLGRRITLDGPDAADTPWLTVIGVVENAAQHEWSAAPQAEIYLPFLATQLYLEGTGAWVSYLTLAIRTAEDLREVVPGLRAAAASLDPDAVIAEIQTMEAVVAEANAEPRFQLLLLAMFAAVALILAALGIHAIVGYTVSQRTHEIGIRMALGARRGRVVGRIVGEGMVVALCGAVAGLAGAIAMTRLMEGILYG